MTNVTYRKIRNGDEGKLFSLVKDGFHESVEKDLTEQGTEEFFRATQEMIHERPNEHTIFVAQSNEEIVGMIFIREDGHICLFFVKKNYQGKGLGRKLLEIAKSELIRNKRDEIKMDVNSSLFAVKAYEKMGFAKIKDIQIVNGIKFVPMEKLVG